MNPTSTVGSRSEVAPLERRGQGTRGSVAQEPWAGRRLARNPAVRLGARQPGQPRTAPTHHAPAARILTVPRPPFRNPLQSPFLTHGDRTQATPRTDRVQLRRGILRGIRDGPWQRTPWVYGTCTGCANPVGDATLFARDRAFANRRAVADGRNPLAGRRKARTPAPSQKQKRPGSPHAVAKTGPSLQRVRPEGRALRSIRGCRAATNDEG